MFLLGHITFTFTPENNPETSNGLGTEKNQSRLQVLVMLLQLFLQHFPSSSQLGDFLHSKLCVDALSVYL